MTTNTSVFKNEAAKRAYFAVYDNLLNSWPVAYESKYVSTSFGNTHVLVSGPAKGKPIVLLHGKGGSATSWRDNIAALSREHRVYAIDILGDLGKSTITKRYTNRGEFADWLTQVLDGLEIQKTDMVGLSMGSYLVANFAIAKPERLKKIVLLAPGATFSSSSMMMNLKAIIGVMTESELIIKQLCRSMVGSNELIEDELVKQSILAMKSEAIVKEKPYLFPERLPDEELKTIKVPTLLAIGEYEKFNSESPEVIMERAKRLIPNIQTTIVPNGYHSLSITNPEQVNDLILRFLPD